MEGYLPLGLFTVIKDLFVYALHPILKHTIVHIIKLIESKFLHYPFIYSLYAVLKHAFTLHIICHTSNLN